MFYLSLSILSSCTLLWLFRYFSDKKLNIPGIITVNYITCLVATIWVNAEELTLNSLKEENFQIFAFLLGGLFIVTFNIMSRTVTYFGIMISSVTQKMSLIAPILIGVLFYSENLSFLRIIGIIAAIGAIVVINMPFKEEKNQQNKIIYWIYPFLTWLLSSVIDTAFYILGKSTGSKQSAIFLFTLFATAASLGMVFIFISYFRVNNNIPKHILPFGILLGIPNFMSIYYLMKAIGQGWDASLMFPINNVGIIGLSMLGALLIFKESANKYKYIGIGLAIGAVVLITLS
jgi:drug/metabolite transporter (DMT)-like permease